VNYLPRLNLNHDPPDLSLPNNYNYRYEPPGLAVPMIFIIFVL
jgi:hypothetical protein